MVISIIGSRGFLSSEIMITNSLDTHLYRVIHTELSLSEGRIIMPSIDVLVRRPTSKLDYKGVSKPNMSMTP